MHCETFSIEGLRLFTPKLISDNRGYFFESLRSTWFDIADELSPKFVQENQSRSGQGAVRGLHYQFHHTQGKLVRVLSGRIFDVAVDMREGSLTFGQWQGVYLDSESHQSFWIPAGFAHGFMVVSQFADVFYKCTDYYDPKSEISLLWNDAQIGIQWPDYSPIVSEKDALGVQLQEAPSL